MKTRLLLSLFAVLMYGISWAQVPSTINFQGVLTDATDTPIDGTFDMTFRIYDADVDGNMMWEESQLAVTVAKGLFNVQLGSVTPIDFDFTSSYYLSVQKGSESELSPRIALLSVPSSISTSSLKSASNSIPASGNAGIGTSAPLAKLHVEEGGTEDALRVRIGGVTKLMVKNDGNVGISTTSPTEVLDVNGKVRIRGGAPGNGKVLTSDASGVATWQTASSGIAEINSSGGNVGIGTTSQKVKLSVNGKTYVKGDGDQGTGDTFTPTIDLSIDDSDTGFEVPSDGTLTMFTNNVERARITSGGQVGIGTTVPNSMFHVNAPSTGDAMRVQVDGNTRFFIESDGQVAIGGFFTPSYPLEVSGNVAGASFVNTSDIRWKKHIKTLDNSLQKVISLRGVSYDWRVKEFPSKGFEKGRQLGFIAQEVEKVLPELVTTDEQGYKSVKYANITAVLVNAIQEQQVIIEALQRELNKANETQEQFSAELAALRAIVVKELQKQQKKSITASN